MRNKIRTYSRAKEYQTFKNDKFEETMQEDGDAFSRDKQSITGIHIYLFVIGTMTNFIHLFQALSKSVLHEAKVLQTYNANCELSFNTSFLSFLI